MWVGGGQEQFHRAPCCLMLSLTRPASILFRSLLRGKLRLKGVMNFPASIGIARVSYFSPSIGSFVQDPIGPSWLDGKGEKLRQSSLEFSLGGPDLARLD